MNRNLLSELTDYNEAWRKRAVCADGRDMFPDPTNTRGITYAKSACERCPVRAECLETAMQRGEEHGVWGGLTSPERRKLRVPGQVAR